MSRVFERMRGQWDEMAKRNAFYSVASRPEFQAADRIDLDKFWRTGRQEVEEALSRLDLGRTEAWAMVEIGCGLGRMTHSFAGCFKEVYAVDVSSEMLLRAKLFWEHLRNIHFILGHGNDLPGIDDQSIDFVFSAIVLQHVPDPQIVKDYIREAARVLRPGGIAYLQFRTDVDSVRANSSLRSRVGRALVQPRRALRTVALRLRARLFTPRRIDQSASWTLADEFGRFDSWRGSALHPAEVEVLVADLGLYIEDISAVQTQYTFYRFRRI